MEQCITLEESKLRLGQIKSLFESFDKSRSQKGGATPTKTCELIDLPPSVFDFSQSDSIKLSQDEQNIVDDAYNSVTALYGFGSIANSNDKKIFNNLVKNLYILSEDSSNEEKVSDEVGASDERDTSRQVYELKGGVRQGEEVNKVVSDEPDAPPTEENDVEDKIEDGLTYNLVQAGVVAFSFFCTPAATITWGVIRAFGKEIVTEGIPSVAQHAVNYASPAVSSMVNKSVRRIEDYYDVNEEEDVKHLQNMVTSMSSSAKKSGEWYRYTKSLLVQVAMIAYTVWAVKLGIEYLLDYCNGKEDQITIIDNVYVSISKLAATLSNRTFDSLQDFLSTLPENTPDTFKDCFIKDGDKNVSIENNLFNLVSEYMGSESTQSFSTPAYAKTNNCLYHAYNHKISVIDINADYAKKLTDAIIVGVQPLVSWLKEVDKSRCYQKLGKIYRKATGSESSSEEIEPRVTELTEGGAAKLVTRRRRKRTKNHKKKTRKNNKKKSASKSKKSRKSGKKRKDKKRATKRR